MKDRKIYTLNKISPVGTKHFREGYTLVDTIDDAAGVLVRSQDMHGMEFPASLRAIARAGAGVNNIPIEECAEQGIVGGLHPVIADAVEQCAIDKFWTNQPELALAQTCKHLVVGNGFIIELE